MNTESFSSCPVVASETVPGGAPWGLVERLRNGGQSDLAACADDELRKAYAEGRKDERENLERIGAVHDCPACGGRGEKMVSFNSGPDAWQDMIDCHECKGTGYAASGDVLEAHAQMLGRTGPLGRAISVLHDAHTAFVGNVEGGEADELMEALVDARRGLLMMLEAERLKREREATAPRVIASTVATQQAQTEIICKAKAEESERLASYWRCIRELFQAEDFKLDNMSNWRLPRNALPRATTPEAAVRQLIREATK